MKICILGCGFCGSVFLHHLVKLLDKPLEIDIYDKSANFARGVAYSTNNPEHLLNVPLEKMSAIYDDDNHFLDWLQKSGYKYALKEFVPRKIYGDYLNDLLNDTIKVAEDKNIKLNFIKQEVKNCEALQAKYQFVVLATGMPFKSFNSVSNIWESDQNFTKYANKDVLLIGTGLTTYDILISLYSNSNLIPKSARIISRRTLFPNYHNKPDISYDSKSFLENILNKYSLLEIFSIIKKEAKKLGDSWQLAFDSLRPIHSRIWHNLSLDERQKFLDRLLTYWNIHRHRAPRQTYNKAWEIIQKYDIKIIKGDVRNFKNSDKYTIINCLGFQVPKPIEGNFIKLGGLNFMEDFEITAVPELRKDVFLKAKEMVKKLDYLS